MPTPSTPKPPAPPEKHAAFPSLDLPFGGEALVEVKSTQRRFKSTFLGMDRGQFVLLRLPANRQLLDVLTPRLELTVRFLMEGGRICGFQSQVAHISVKPYPLLFLTYPRRVEVLKLRKHDRVSCFQPILFYLGGEEVRGVIVNISVGGCRLLVEGDGLEALQANAPGEQVIFQFRLFGSEETTYLQGVVKTASMDHDKLALGVAFRDLDIELADQIERFVDTMLAYQQM